MTPLLIVNLDLARTLPVAPSANHWHRKYVGSSGVSGLLELSVAQGSSQFDIFLISVLTASQSLPCWIIPQDLSFSPRPAWCPRACDIVQAYNLSVRGGVLGFDQPGIIVYCFTFGLVRSWLTTFSLCHSKLSPFDARTGLTQNRAWIWSSPTHTNLIRIWCSRRLLDRCSLTVVAFCASSTLRFLHSQCSTLIKPCVYLSIT